MWRGSTVIALLVSCCAVSAVACTPPNRAAGPGPVNGPRLSTASASPTRSASATASASATGPASTGSSRATPLRGQTSPIHDPALIVAGGIWYVFSTGLVHRENGGTIQISSSKDGGASWSAAGTVWKKIPTWIDRRFADGGLPDNLWAPDIHEHAGTFYLYYSASRFGSNESVTALATNTTLDPTDPAYRWVDAGPVISSPVTDIDPADPSKTFNAIDPGLVEEHGKPYLSIGSFWSGIYLVPLQWPSGKPAKGWKAGTVHLAERQVEGDPIEGAFITRHGGYYYLFASFDLCCRGADSTYKIAVGRARSVRGPYQDEKGLSMLQGGGTVILKSHDNVVGPGGQSVYDDELAFHFYDADNQTSPYIPTLGLRRISWGSGWPVLQ